MADPQPSTEDYGSIFLSLLPTGPVWPRDTGSVISQVGNAIGLTAARCATRAFGILQESPVGQRLVEMLPEWERAEGLPDPCAGPDPTIALRQAHVRARFAYAGGQSVPYFIAFAQALGFTITVTEFAPARFGRPFGSFGGATWAHTWKINLEAGIERPFQFGQGRFGEPFAAYGDAVLQCELTRIKPAHTVLQFAAAV